MKLWTKTTARTMPAVYSQEDVADPVVKLHYFDPCGAADWFIIEASAEDDDVVMFGLCDLGMGFPELGEVSLSDLQSGRGPLGLGIERDLYWSPRPLSAVRADRAGSIY